MDAGDHARAAQMFADVAETHAGGPLTAEALFLRGQALDLAGQPREPPPLGWRGSPPIRTAHGRARACWASLA